MCETDWPTGALYNLFKNVWVDPSLLSLSLFPRAELWYKVSPERRVSGCWDVRAAWVQTGPAAQSGAQSTEPGLSCKHHTPGLSQCPARPWGGHMAHGGRCHTSVLAEADLRPWDFPLSDDIMQGDTDISDQVDTWCHVWWPWWGVTEVTMTSVLWACESSAGQWVSTLAKQLLIWMWGQCPDREVRDPVIRVLWILTAAIWSLLQWHGDARYDCEESIECHNHNIDSQVILRSCQDLTPSSRLFMFT